MNSQINSIIKRIKFNKIKTFFQKIPWFLAEHAFLTLLGLLFLSLFLGGIVFYQYSVLAKREIPEVIEKPLEFDKELYQIILNEWRARAERFAEIDLKEHPDPFSI